MQLKIKATFDNAEEAAIFVNRLAGIAPTIDPAKPEKQKKDKPDTKVTGTPDTKVVQLPPDTKTPEPKTEGSEFDNSTPETIEAGRVKLRAKVSALNEAGYMEHTKKALSAVGAASITKMDPEKHLIFWEKLGLIEAGQADKI